MWLSYSDRAEDGMSLPGRLLPTPFSCVSKLYKLQDIVFPFLNLLGALQLRIPGYGPDLIGKICLVYELEGMVGLQLIMNVEDKVSFMKRFVGLASLSLWETGHVLLFGNQGKNVHL